MVMNRIVCILVVACASLANAGEAELRSPWDLHPVSLTDAAYTCSAAPQLPHDFATNSYYTDSHHSVIDPALKKKYEDSVAGIDGFTRDVVKAADAFQTTGSRAAVQCVSTLLVNAAQQKAMTGNMDGNQAAYVRKWNLGAWAIAYLKVRSSGVVAEDSNKTIAAWMKKLAENSRGYVEDGRNHGAGDSYNNHLYWTALAVGAAAIVNNDRGLFRFSTDAYKQGVHDIRDDGTLPREMDRGQMALHYHLYALAPLIMIAELGETNGVDLYAERDFAIKRLVVRCVEGLDDPKYFQQRTGVEQVTTPEIQVWEISWAQPYTRRFPDPHISALLGKVHHLNYTMLGGLPPP
jgi:poly(beta-D-mannuronate) lyase